MSFHRNVIGRCTQIGPVKIQFEAGVLSTLGGGPVASVSQEIRPEDLRSRNFRVNEPVLCDLRFDGNAKTWIPVNAVPVATMFPREDPPNTGFERGGEGSRGGGRGGRGGRGGGSGGSGGRRSGPNFFVSFPIVDPGLIAELGRLREAMVPRFGPFLVEPGVWHVSLVMLKISKVEDVFRAREIVNAMQEEMRAQEVKRVTFGGIGEFGSRVSFVEMVENREAFIDLIIAVKERLHVAGIEVLEMDREPKPHLTMAKVRGNDVLPSRLELQGFHQTVFGTQGLDTLRLCSHLLPFVRGSYWSF